MNLQILRIFNLQFIVKEKNVFKIKFLWNITITIYIKYY